MVPGKRPWLAIEIMRRVVEQVSDAHLVVVGEGNDSVIARCKNLCHKYGIEENVSFVGYQIDVNSYWQNASVHLSTSEIEGYPMVLIEAKAYGIPTVMDDLSYLANAQPHTGVIQVPGMSVQIAAERVVKLLTDQPTWERESMEAMSAFEALKEYDCMGAWESFLRDGKKQVSDESAGYAAVRAMIKHHLMGLSDIREQNMVAINELKEKHGQEILSIKEQSEATTSKLRKIHAQEINKIKDDDAKIRQLIPEEKTIRLIYGTKYATLARRYRVEMIIEENNKLWGEMLMQVPVCSPEIMSEFEGRVIVYSSKKCLDGLRKKYNNSNLVFCPLDI